jgi:hypothetical protein
LKLVVPCKLGQGYWVQYVLSEYLAYRMLNLLTPLSFRVRLAEVKYIDSTGKDEEITRYGFLIEDDSDMAARNGGAKMDWPSGMVLPTAFEKNYAILVEVFQYLIANTDWSSAKDHNMELVRGPTGQQFAVPYDFDFSGIVDARYAAPDPLFKDEITDVRQRLFRGWCSFLVGRLSEDYEPVYEVFREKKDDIYSLWRNQVGLEEDTLKDNLEYLDEFYETLADPEKIESRMTAKCRKSEIP